MSKHTIYMYNDNGRFLGEQTLEKSAAHPRRFTDIAPPPAEDGKVFVFNFAEWIKVDYSYFEPSLESLKFDLIIQLRNDFNYKINTVKQDNASYEIDTWATQCSEWTSYIQDNNNPTPYVDALATARGVPKAELMAKIGLKVVGIATIQGTQHRIEDQIKASPTKEVLNSIIWI